MIESAACALLSCYLTFAHLCLRGFLGRRFYITLLVSLRSPRNGYYMADRIRTYFVNSASMRHP